MGGGYFVTMFFLLLFILLQFHHPCSALPLCTDSSGPFTPTGRLQFCSYNGTSCCNSTDDSRLQRQFQSINVSDTNCASLVRSIMCADQYEEVDLITRGGNYGWRAYEGTYPYTPRQSPGRNTSLSSIRPIFPVMGYNHSEVNVNEGSASITGGYFYRSVTDPCLYGRYLFANLYADAIWSGAENPSGSGNFTTSEIAFTCARDSPLNCTFTPGSPLPSLSYIFSFGEDNNRDVYLLTNSGVHRVVRPSRCSYTCASENTTNVPNPGPGSSPGSKASSLTYFPQIMEKT